MEASLDLRAPIKKFFQIYPPEISSFPNKCNEIEKNERQLMKTMSKS